MSQQTPLGDGPIPEKINPDALPTNTRRDSLLCKICGMTQIEHEHLTPQPHHGFSADGKLFVMPPVTTSPYDPNVRKTPVDPILRMLLIRKGIVTPDELTQLENELKASGVVTS